MRIDLALFEGDSLLGRGEVTIESVEGSTALGMCSAMHQLSGDMADVVLSSFPSHIDIKTLTLSTAVHESVDWETQDFGRYMLAFWCRLA